MSDPARADRRFPQARRLRTRREFDRTIRLGAKYPDGHFTVYIRQRSTEKSRLGLVIPRAIGKASARNRLRRRLREAFRTEPAIARRGADLVISARPGAAGVPFGEIRRLLARAAAWGSGPAKAGRRT